MFQGVTKFCTLDLCQAYQQLPLSAESQKLTTITTHRGLFLFKKVPYGIALHQDYSKEKWKIFEVV